MGILIVSLKQNKQFFTHPKRILFFLICTAVAASFLMVEMRDVFAAEGINETINFQGRVANTDGTNVADGDYDFVFRLYKAGTGGTAQWTETWNSGTSQATVTNGIFRVALGTHTSLSSLDFNDDSWYLSVEFDGDGEMNPRIQFASVPYALNAKKVAGLTVTDTTGTFTLADGKTFVVNNGLTFSGTDSTTFTFPNASGTVVTLDATQELTNKTIGSTGLVFSGATTDITTATDEHLTLTAAGTGDIIFDLDGDTSFLLDSFITDANAVLYTDTSGVLTRVVETETGSLCLLSGAGASGAPSWGSCPGGGSGSSNWVLNDSDGTLSPINNTLDFLWGGTATDSAKFAILNTAGTGPVTATVSGNLILMPTNGAGGFLGINNINPTRALDMVGRGYIFGQQTTAATGSESQDVLKLEYDFRGNSGSPATYAGSGLNVRSYFGAGAANSIGTAHAISGHMNVVSGGDVSNEYAPLFLDLSSDHGGRLWGADINIHGPYASQADILQGVVTLINNYNSGAVTNGSYGGSIVTRPTAGGGDAAGDRSSRQTYTLDAGFTITGWAGPTSATNGDHASAVLGFDKALQIGGRGSGWMGSSETSKIGTGIDLRDFVSYGIYIHDRHTSAASTAPAIAIAAGQGGVGIGTTTPTGQLHVYQTGTVDPLATFETGSGGSVMFRNTASNISLKIVNIPGDDNFTVGAKAGDSGIVYSTSFGFTLGEDGGRAALRVDGDNLVGIGTSTPISELHVSRSLVLPATGKALAVFDQLEDQDILTASAGGATRFAIANSGQIRLRGGQSPDITTSTTDSNLTISANGAGDVIVSGDGDTNFQVNFSAAPAVDMAVISNSGQGTTTTGVDGLQINFTQAGSSAITNAGLQIDVTSSNSNASSEVLGINVGDITGSTPTETGIRIGTGWDRGLVIESGGSSNSGLVYSGGGRPTKTITLSPEYAGAILTDYYGAGTDTNITGAMTSDTDTTQGTSIRNYYLWNSSETAAQHYYTVAVRVTLPADFSAWATSNALVVNYITENATATQSDLDVYVYNENSATIVASSTDNASVTWTTVAIDDSTLDDGASSEWDAAGETAVIYLRMGSQDDDNVRIGDIVLSYLAKF